MQDFIEAIRNERKKLFIEAPYVPWQLYINFILNFVMQLRVSSCLVFCQRIFPRGFLSYLVKEKFFLLLYSGVLFIQLFCACQIHMWSRLHIQSYHYSNGGHIFRLIVPLSVLRSIATLTV